MDYLNALNYKWVHYGPHLFGNHVRRFGLPDESQIGVGRDNWPPQGNRNTADKLTTSAWLINSVTIYDEVGKGPYYCWFFATIDHERRSIFYRWIKGSGRKHRWNLISGDKNVGPTLIFVDSVEINHQRLPNYGRYDGNKHIIPLGPLIQITEIIIQHEASRE